MPCNKTALKIISKLTIELMIRHLLCSVWIYFTFNSLIQLLGHRIQNTKVQLVVVIWHTHGKQSLKVDLKHIITRRSYGFIALIYRIMLPPFVAQYLDILNILRGSEAFTWEVRVQSNNIIWAKEQWSKIYCHISLFHERTKRWHFSSSFAGHNHLKRFLKVSLTHGSAYGRTVSRNQNSAPKHPLLSSGLDVSALATTDENFQKSFINKISIFF